MIALGDAHQVGRDALLLAREHRPGAAEADRDLVADEQHAELVAQLAQRAQVAVRVHDHPRRALHQRLDDDRRDALAVRLEQPAHVGGVARLGVVGLEQQLAERRVEEVDPADRDRADRVAVVGVAQADELGALRLAAQLPVLVGHLHRDLGGGRAVVGVEDALQPGRRDRHEARRQLRRAGMREAEHRRVRDAVELRLHRGVDRPGGGGRARCTRATRRRRCRRCRRCRRACSPRARSTITGGSRSQPRCCVNGCQRWVRSSSARAAVSMPGS